MIAARPSRKLEQVVSWLLEQTIRTFRNAEYIFWLVFIDFMIDTRHVSV